MIEVGVVVKGTPGDSARWRGLRRAVLPLFGLGMLAGFILGCFVGIVFEEPLYIIGGAAAIFVAGAVVYFHLLPRLMRSYARGARGEEMVAAELEHLPNGWFVFHGIQIGHHHDIDHVVVGPQGVFVVETKFFRGVTRLEGNELLLNGQPLPRSPLLQLREQVGFVSSALGLEHITPVLCLIARDREIRYPQWDEVLLCSQFHLKALLTQGPEVLSASQIARIVSGLSSFKTEELV